MLERAVAVEVEVALAVAGADPATAEAAAACGALCAKAALREDSCSFMDEISARATSLSRCSGRRGRKERRREGNREGNHAGPMDKPSTDIHHDTELPTITQLSCPVTQARSHVASKEGNEHRRLAGHNEGTKGHLMPC